MEPEFSLRIHLNPPKIRVLIEIKQAHKLAHSFQS